MKLTHRRFMKAFVVLFALTFSAFVASAQTSSVAPRITQAIDEGKLVTLRGNTPAQATATNDRGAKVAKTTLGMTAPPGCAGRPGSK